MKKKIIHSLVIILFFLVFGYFSGEEYWEYQNQQENSIISEKNISEKLDIFSLESIGELSGRTELFSTPDVSFLDTLVAEIDNAQSKIYVEVYIFTETRLRDAIIGAYKRGIEVKILLENNPYQAPYINDKHYASFRDAGIDVRWSDPLNYSLNHSKLLIIDDVAYISTGNFSYSLFKYNRDFLLKIHDVHLYDSLEAIFLQDYNYTKNIPYHDNLIVSPEYSRVKLEALILGAKEKIDFYFPYMQDEVFQKKLFLLAEEGVQIRAIVDESFYKENSNMIADFKKNNISTVSLKKEKLHGKAILVDERYLYIGSINFSTYSFDENREIGVLLKDTHIIKTFKSMFENDYVRTLNER